jgi:hypothetical protein
VALFFPFPCFQFSVSSKHIAQKKGADSRRRFLNYVGCLRRSPFQPGEHRSIRFRRSPVALAGDPRVVELRHPGELTREGRKHGDPAQRAKLAGERLFFKSQRPFDATQHVRAIQFRSFRSIPAVGETRIQLNEVFAMTDGGVEDAAGAI